jgi:two-component system, cell cycle sensor histidine kinase and response regulator CckA
LNAVQSFRCLRTPRHWIALAIVLILSLGAAVSCWTARTQDNLMRVELLTHAQMVAKGVDAQRAARLTGSEQDLNSPDYQRIKAQLNLVRSVMPRCRFLYLLGRHKDGEVFFFVDAESPASKDYSPPGQVYGEASKSTYQVFATGREVVEGPVSDRWGTWVSALTPLTDPTTGTIVAVLGLYVDSRDWKNQIVLHSLVPTSITLLALLVLGTFFILYWHMGRKRMEEALKERIEFLSTLMEAIPNPVFYKDREGRYTGFNKAFEILNGRSRQELLGKTVYDIAPKEIADTYAQKDSELLENPGTQTYEWLVRTKAGELRDVVFNKAAIRDAEGRVVGLVGVISDITERKRVEEALRQSEAKYRRLHESMRDAFASVDMAGWIQEANLAYQAMLSYSEEELRGLTYQDLTPEKWHAFEESIVKEQLLVRGYTDVYEKEYRRKDGTVFPVELRTIGLHDDAGRMVGMWAIVRDITERKRAEETLSDSEEKYSAVVRMAKDGVVIMRDNVLEFANEATARMLGYTVDEMENTPYANYVAPESREMVAAMVKARLSGEDVPQVYEAMLLRKEGTKITVELSASVIHYQGKPAEVGIIRDITERKRAEEERSKLESQMREVQKFESLGVLAGGIAHDFNNLLVAILGNADLALFSLSPASPVRKSIEGIRQASQRAADLCRQMLAYAGKGRYLVGRHNLSGTVGEMREILGVSVSKQSTVCYFLADDLPAVEADETQLCQVIMNLITNASDALGDGSGDISVTTGIMVCDRAFLAETYLGDQIPEGTYVYLEVSDTGCGMDAETRDKIFEPFFTTKFIGRGLGLSAVLGIVRGHKGAIKVASELGKGTIVRILLPAVK